MASKPPQARQRKPIPKTLIFASLVVILAAIFFVPLSKMLTDPRRETDIKLTGAGLSIITKAQTSAATDQQKQGGAIQPGAEQRAAVNAKAVADNISKIQGRTILWVDDHPENNVELQNAFAEAGVRVFTALSNEQAQALLAYRSFDFAITDIGRDAEGPTAGLAMLPILANRSIATAVYSASWSGGHRGLEKQYQVAKITNDPTEVYAAAIDTFKAK